MAGSSTLRGYSEHSTDNYLIAINLNEPWDWKQNITENAIVKKPNPATGTSVPVLVRGALCMSRFLLHHFAIEPFGEFLVSLSQTLLRIC